MSDTPEITPRKPVGSLALLTIVVLAGLILFFVLERRTPVVVVPVGTEEPQ
ncbi:MAG: hypothetical protein HOP28_14865 [Gemmatimonadales bacterium]|nr:hypothetical protein [Gemmatimonadales bacterium]